MRLGGRWAVVTVLGALVLAAPASATDAPFEAETMTPATGTAANTNFSDSAADGGKALALYNNGAATKTVTVPQSTNHLLVRVRGSDCTGAPTISVKIDGVQRFAGAVSTGAYKGVGARLSIPSGSHTVSVNMTNDYVLEAGGTKICDRNVFVDTVRIVGQPFSTTGWRNTPLPASAPIDAKSTDLVGDIHWQIANPVQRANGTTAPDVWVTYSRVSTPVYVVNKDQPTVVVTSRGAHMGDQWNAVPLPPDARPADGEGELVVWQPETDTMWEFYELAKDQLTGAWTATFGGRIQNVSSNEGDFPLVSPPGRYYGAAASKIAHLAGIPRIEELKRGVIDHPIDFAVMNGKGYDGWCWPAHGTDHQPHWRRDDAAIPAGKRFRLRADFDLDAWAATHPMNPYGLMLARAIQKWGMFARDQGEGFGFWAEDPAPTGTDPYAGPGGLFAGESPRGSGVFRNFPWHELQALAQPGGVGQGCQVDPDVFPPNDS